MEASTLRGLRTGVVILLLLALPVVALSESPGKILSWLIALRSTISPAPSSSLAAAGPVATIPAPSSNSVELTADEPETAVSEEQTLAANPPAAAPETATADAVAESANARLLRRPVYRPMADVDQFATIRRVPAEDESIAVTSPEEARQIDAAQEQLRRWGAAQYRLDENPASADFSFVCSFDAAVGQGAPRTFRASAPNRLQAMQQVIEQVQAWRDETRLGLSQTPELR
jgi:hypothetical protein